MPSKRLSSYTRSLIQYYSSPLTSEGTTDLTVTRVVDFIESLCISNSGGSASYKDEKPDGTTSYGISGISIERANVLGFAGLPEDLLDTRQNLFWCVGACKYSTGSFDFANLDYSSGQLNSCWLYNSTPRYYKDSQLACYLQSFYDVNNVTRSDTVIAGNAKSHEFKLRNVPITRGSLSVSAVSDTVDTKSSAPDLVLRDDGKGNLSGNGSGTVDYSTGSVSTTFSDATRTASDIKSDYSAPVSGQLTSPEMLSDSSGQYLSKSSTSSVIAKANSFESPEVDVGDTGSSEITTSFYNDFNGPPNFVQSATSSAPPCANNGGYEVIDPYPMPSNPFFAYVRIWIGDDGPGYSAFELQPNRPQYLSEFHYVEEANQTGSCRFTIFDPDWDGVANQVFTSGGVDATSNSSPINPVYQRVRFEWGYAPRGEEDGGPMAPVALAAARSDFILTRWSPRFLGYGAIIDVECVTNIALPRFNQQSSIQKNDEGTSSSANSKSEIDVSGSGPSKIVELLARSLPGVDEVCVSPTAENKRRGEDGYVEKAIPYFLSKDLPSSFADLTSFTKNVLSDDAIFSIYYDSETKVLHFHSAPYGEGTIVRDYTYAKLRNGAVIDWQPIFESTTLLAVGGGRVAGDTIHPTTGDSVSAVANSERVVERQNSGVGSSPGVVSELNINDRTGDEPPKDSIAGQPTMRFIDTASVTPDQLKNQLLAWQQLATAATLEGRLTIIGDPLIKPYRTVAVNAYTLTTDELTGLPEASAHWSSGVWIVTRVRHAISAGNYTTQLTLLRNDWPSRPGAAPESSTAPEPSKLGLGDTPELSIPEDSDTRSSSSSSTIFA